MFISCNFDTMKYRILTSEELEVFAEDFKHFLIVNGVHNEEWVEMNQSAVEKAKQFVELFSDTVLQKVYEKLKFVEHRSEKSCMVFKLNEEHVELISVNAKEGSDVNLSTPESIHEALVNSPDQLTFFKSQKPYTNSREEEIHKMLEQGCVHSSEAFWISLEKVVA